jgi:ribosomal protein S18 acetylase RimI-like enzyme
VSPAWFHRVFQAQGLVWVAEEAGAPVGFATCEAFDDALHLWELAVAHGRQRRGTGRALIAAVVGEARRRSLPAVTLTTFRDIAWNAPYYRRLGFEVLAPEALNPRLAEIRTLEASKNLDVAARCAMRLDLDP